MSFDGVRAAGADALWAPHRFPASHTRSVESSPTGHADQGFIFGVAERWWGIGMLKARRESRAVRRRPVPQVFDRLWARSVFPVDRNPALSPPQCLFETLGLLLTDGHLPISLQDGNLPPLGHKGLPDAVHLPVVAPARLVILIQRRCEGIP